MSKMDDVKDNRSHEWSDMALPMPLETRTLVAAARRQFVLRDNRGSRMLSASSSLYATQLSLNTYFIMYLCGARHIDAASHHFGGSKLNTIATSACVTSVVASSGCILRARLGRVHRRPPLRKSEKRTKGVERKMATAKHRFDGETKWMDSTHDCDNVDRRFTLRGGLQKCTTKRT